MADRTCRACSSSIEHRGPKALYCNQQCRDWCRFHPGELLDWSQHKCRYCGESLSRAKLDLRFCNSKCMDRGTHGAAPIPATRNCRHCGGEFEVDHGHRVFCSPGCRDDAFLPGWYEKNRAHIRDRAREYRRRTGKGTEGVHRYQARKRAGEVERFSNREIFERDGWICQLCGSDVDEALRWPHPFSASLDHATPVSKGGHHVRANVQLAHLRCNISKSDKVVDRALEA